MIESWLALAHREILRTTVPPSLRSKQPTQRLPMFSATFRAAAAGVGGSAPTQDEGRTSLPHDGSVVGTVALGAEISEHLNVFPLSST